MTGVSDADRVAAELVQNYRLSADDLVIEVGSGNGTLLRAIQVLGPRVLGIEPNVRMMAQAFEAGIDTIAAQFTSETARYVQRRYGPAHLVVAHSSPANGLPLELVRAASYCLGSNGVLVFVGQSLFADIRPDPRPIRRAA